MSTHFYLHQAHQTLVPTAHASFTGSTAVAELPIKNTLEMMADSVEGLFQIAQESPTYLKLLNQIMTEHKNLTKLSDDDLRSFFSPEEMSSILMYKRELSSRQDKTHDNFQLGAEDYAKAALISILSITNPNLVIDFYRLSPNLKAARAVKFFEKALDLSKNKPEQLDKILQEFPLLAFMKSKWGLQVK